MSKSKIMSIIIQHPQSAIYYDPKLLFRHHEKFLEDMLSWIYFLRSLVLAFNRPVLCVGKS